MKRLIPLIFISCVFLWLYPTTAMAADSSSEKQSNVTITIVMPDTPATPAQSPVKDERETILTQVPTVPASPAISPLYPISVDEIRENGERRIIKVYELDADENPSDISRDSFDRDRWHYELADITKAETAMTDAKEHVETIEVSTGTKDTDAILRQLAPTMEYESEDGYVGVLTLNVGSIKVGQAGTKTSSYTVTATREYPHLSSNDSSLVPKTITDGGKTYTLANVDWRSGNTETIDYERLPEYYTAYATYTATASKTVVTGYVTTAEYEGTIARINQGRTVYTAVFIGTEIVPERVALEFVDTALPPDETPNEDVADVAAVPEAETSADPTAMPDPSSDPSGTLGTDATPKPSVEQVTPEAQSLNIWPVVIPVALLALIIGGGAGFFITKKNQFQKKKG